MIRDDRQTAVHTWVVATFGETCANSRMERAQRVLEEAIELAQAEGLVIHQVYAVARHVFDKPAGYPKQEAGGVGVTLLAYCATRNFSADEAEYREFERVQKIDPGVFRARQNVKADAGIAMHARPPSNEALSSLDEGLEEARHTIAEGREFPTLDEGRSK